MIWGLLASAGAEKHGSVVVLTLSVAIAAGGFLTILGKRSGVPGIILLLFGGVCLGPEGWNIVQPESLGEILNVLVSLSVGLILFEGGLTLNVDGYRAAGRVIRRLLTIGVLLTWSLTAFAVWVFYRFPPTFCILMGSLVIVTGPTVIQPILKRIHLRWKLHQTLHWEGVLIDPIGVFAAVLAFEWVVGAGGEAALSNLGIRVLSGFAIGFIGGEVICFLLKHRAIPEELLNVFMLAAAVLVFGTAEAMIHEGGLLSVTVAGLVVGARQPPELKAIVHFKSILVDLLIGFVFILLTARLELRQFFDFGAQGFILVGVVICVVRPVVILICTWGSEMTVRERLFLSWVAPRGVVAASMASLFALALAQQGRFAHPEFVESFVYSVIFVTVVSQGFSAGPLAWALRLKEASLDGWMIVGAHPLACSVATFLRDVRKVPVLLIDGNRQAVKDAEAMGLPVILGDAREADMIEERAEFEGIGRVLAFTDNEDLNELLCKKWEVELGKGRVYRWASTQTSMDSETGVVLWSWMPKPSVVSSEVMLGEAALTVRMGERLASSGVLEALMTAHDKEVLLDPGPASKLKSKRDEAQTLYLQREADYLLNAISPSCLLRFEGTDKEALLREMVALGVKEYSLLNEVRVLDEVIRREAAMPVSMGRGIALPHGRVSGLDQPCCVIAQVPEGLVYHDSDQEPVRLVFLLLSPENEAEMHLAVLGEIARLVADAEVRQKMMDCEELEAVITVIRQYRRMHTPFAAARG